jgi:hypothetical protein
MRMHPMLRRTGIALAAGGGLLLVVDAWAGDGAGPTGSDARIPPVTFPQAIYLDAPTLARLAVTNPNHFARAERILKAANYLCRPRVPDVYLASFGAQDLSCEPMVLLTSNPPQWRIGFRLDETRYVAAVWITDDPPRALPAR